MKEKPTPPQIEGWLTELTARPTFIERLDNYDLQVLQDALTDRVGRERMFLFEFLEANPQNKNNPAFRYHNLELSERLLEMVTDRLTSGSNNPKDKFSKSKKEQKDNGRTGGQTKGERKYQEFQKWVSDNGFKVAEYKDSSNVQFMTALKSKGFSISDKTAGDYKKRFLSEFTGK